MLGLDTSFEIDHDHFVINMVQSVEYELEFTTEEGHAIHGISSSVPLPIPRIGERVQNAKPQFLILIRDIEHRVNYDYEESLLLFKTVLIGKEL